MFPPTAENPAPSGEPAPQSASEPTPRRSALGAATSISGLTLVSRLLGLVRDVVMLRVLGVGYESGTFVLAWMAPNLLRRLVGEGALAASFVPAYAAALDRDGPQRARGLLASVAGAALVALAALVAVVLVACAVVPPGWLGAGDADPERSGALLLRLTAILFPYVLLVSMTAVLGGALNAHGVFGWPAALPVVLNLFWIAGLVLGMRWTGGPEGVVTVTAWFLLAGGVAQLAIVAWLLRRRKALPLPRLPAAGDPARAVFARMGPTVVGLSMLQLNTLLDQAIAYWFIDAGSNVYVYLANRLLLFPHALTALALATAVFPRFAVLASREANEELRERVADAQRSTLFLTVPASAGLMLVAYDLLATFFVGPEFESADARVAAWTTACLVAGLPFVSAAQLWARALYALGDMRAPARVATALVPLNVVLNLLLALGLGLGVPGLAIATGLCAVANAVALRRAFDARCPGAARPWRGLSRILGATVVMAGAVVLIRDAVPAASRIEVALLHLALPVAAGAGTYALVHWGLGGEELPRLWARLRRRP